MIIYFDETELSSDLLEQMKAAAEEAVRGEGIDPDRTEISVSFADKEEIRDLNRIYRHVDKPTDVLSFPQYDDLNYIPEEGEIPIGDVVICTEQAKEQAEEFGTGMERELLYLFTHSILHLLGYDHIDEVDKMEMRKREEEIMDYLGVPRRKDGAIQEDKENAKVGEITEEDIKLFVMAEKASELAYAPFSEYKVGAALKTYSGEVFTGVNVENSSFGGTICAERTACCKAISEGYRDFTKIAIASKQGKATPCGICRQFLYEFSEDLEVITGESVDSLSKIKLKDLLPDGFRL